MVNEVYLGSAIKAINQMATLRNWLIGYYIVEYEQNGSDRAKYGDKLLKRLEERVNTKGLNETLFLAARRFYSFYPQIADIISPSIHPILSDKSSVDNEISATASQESAISATASPKFVTPAPILISRLSFSHIREIMLQDVKGQVPGIQGTGSGISNTKRRASLLASSHISKK